MIVKPSKQPDQRRQHDEHADLLQPGRDQRAHPALATAAPAMPPTSACDELVGRPRYQVITSHAIAPTSPAKITPLSRTSGSTTSFAIVAATAGAEDQEGGEVEERRPRDGLSRGESTRVETTVAMEFAASWKPLKKSNASATAMIRTTARVIVD